MSKLFFIVFIFFTSWSYAQRHKPDTSLFVLKGNMADFQLIYLAIKSPMDITPRQDTALLHWIQTIEPFKKPPVDSMKTKK